MGIGLFIPGSTIILLMGGLAANGTFDLGDLLWFAVIGAVIGDNINYYIGKKYGKRLLNNGFWIIKPAHFKKGEGFFEKHGAKSVFIGRFVPSLKEIVPLIAGVFRMKHLPFMLWNILGAIGWSLAWVLPGYFFAQSIGLAQVWLTRVGFFLLILVVLFLGFYLLDLLLIKKGKNIFTFLSSVWRSVMHAITENKDVQKLVKRHDKFFKFWQRRFDKSIFFGRPLTFFFIALVYVTSLLAGVIQDVVSSDIIVSLDIRVANLLALFINEQLVRFFIWITLLGKLEIVSTFIAATILILWIWEKRLYIIPLIISVAGSSLFTYIGKLVIHRERPLTAFYTESTFAFPSGHATIATAFYGFIAYLLIGNTKLWKNKINIFFVSLWIILAIGFSRLYLGVHYVSDVWSGYLVGIIWLIIGVSISEYLRTKKQPTHTISKKRNKLFTIIIVTTSIAIYTIFAIRYQISPTIFIEESSQIETTDVMTIFKTDQMRFTETLIDNEQEPLSFIVTAQDDQHLMDAFDTAGWFLADEVSVSNIIKFTKASFTKEPYPQAPMTPSFWNASVHDFGFEKSTDTNSVAIRHHARFWKTNYLMSNGDSIYVGTASFDEGMKWGVTHRIAPDIDTEREFLLKDLEATGLVSDLQKHQFVDPRLGNNFAGDAFFTDGSLYSLVISR